MVVTLHPGLLVNKPVNLVFFLPGRGLVWRCKHLFKKKSGIFFFLTLRSLKMEIFDLFYVITFIWVELNNVGHD